MAPLSAAPRVLIVRTGAIGDVVNALVFAAALRDARPNAHIGWVAHPLVVPLLDQNPCVDTVHVWPRGSGVRGTMKVIRAIRAARYDVALDLQRLQKSALLARLSGAPRVIGFDKGRCKEHSHLWTREQLPKGDPRAHMVEQYLDFARYLELAPEAPRWPLPALAAARMRVDALLAPIGGASFLAVNLGASKPEKRWPDRHFAALLAHPMLRSHAIVLTGGPGDRAAAESVAQAAAGRALDLVGRTSLLELTAVLERAALTVTGDTGAMHLAVARSRPVVALFGPGDPQRTGPYRQLERVLRMPPWDGTQRRTAKMEDLTPDAVAIVVATVLTGL